MTEADHSQPRWVLRLEVFTRAVGNLDQAVLVYSDRPLTVLEQAGMIQLFEIAWELGWKTMRDYLEAAGSLEGMKSPVAAIRSAFEVGLIADGQGWMDATKLRHTLAHEYDPRRAEDALKAIADRHLALFRALSDKMNDEDFASRHA